MLAWLMALIAAFVSAYAVSKARFAPGKIPIACCKNCTPSMRGMRWSASSNATLSLRNCSCFNRSSAPSGESLPNTRYSAPYCERRSRSIARKTSESSSTLSRIGLAMLALSSRQKDDFPIRCSQGELRCTSLDPQFFGQRLPLAVDQCFRLGIHHNLIGPRPCEAFGRPFASGVDAHLGAVIGEARGVIERVDGAESELDVALRVDVIKNFQSDVGNVLHVDILVDHDDGL